MPITADTPAPAGSAPTDPAPTTSTPTLPIPEPDRVERALAAVFDVYRRADARTRRWWVQSITLTLAGEVLRLRALDEQLDAAVSLDVRPTGAQVGHALAAARRSDRHPSGSNLRVLAAEVHGQGAELAAIRREAALLAAEVERLRAVEARVETLLATHPGRSARGGFLLRVEELADAIAPGRRGLWERTALQNGEG